VLKSEGRKHNMDFQRQIGLISGKNNSFIKAFQDKYCSQIRLRMISMILHKQNRQNQKEMKRKQKNKMLNNVMQPDSQSD